MDELALSMEDDDGPNVGLVSDHLAYRMYDARFEGAQAEAWKITQRGPVAHYRMVTGWTCLDVLTLEAPTFAVTEERPFQTVRDVDPGIVVDRLQLPDKITDAALIERLTRPLSSPARMHRDGLLSFAIHKRARFGNVSICKAKCTTAD